MNVARGWIGRLSLAVAVAVLTVPMAPTALPNAANVQAEQGSARLSRVALAQEATPTLEAMQACGGELSISDPVSGVIGFPGAECYYTFQGSSGYIASLSMERMDGDLAPEMILLGPDGSQLATSQLSDTNDGLAMLSNTLDETGTYTVIARSLDSETSGTFTLTLRMFILAVSPCGGPIRYGQSRTGLAGGELGLDCSFSFSGSAGDVVTIKVVSTDGALDPMVALYSPGDPDNPEAENDDGIGTDSLILHHALAETGDYSILASAYDGEGDFKLTLTTGWYKPSQMLQVVYSSLPLRATAGYKSKPSSDVVGQVQKGASVRVLSGPTFKDGLVWYRVQTSQKKVGWAPEIDSQGRLVFAP